MNRSTRTPPACRCTVLSADGTPIGYRTMGDGPGLIVVGGALRTAEDYLPLASALARSFTVHLVERRGRGASGPLGPRYALGKEVDDLLAVQAETGARSVFGHSYGGLVVLETARSSRVFDRIAVYEPGVPCLPVPTAWMDPYRERLAAGDPHGAFVHFIRGSGGAPAFVSRMPYWYLRLALRVAFRGPSWQRMLPLLDANLAEHGQLAAQYGRLAEFAAVTAPVLILCGGRTARASRAEFDALRDTLPEAALETLGGLDHFGPEGKNASVVAERVLAFLR
ncbi:alpha/beta hydrolase [Planomonospora parontospora subsp. parontospora]|uniref:Alpha/beta hydrolase n=2 Tax=Planomonospora parontospora TaxID=58119 RepID=A0AA37BMN2_9ACTN|nr:alpha/beta hydrolase [Planomonospora parontospora]GGK93290.1 alpha/beta hydrolase [Planomonospora parontospora]GII12254.1 alpha/beta hydrolase [Planomonospora parontospora subsp. parontospora]